MLTRNATCLFLTLHRHWFDMIMRGEKPEEYREIKPYWLKRLLGRSFEFVHFRNGYGQDRPEALFKLESISTGRGRPEWGAPSKNVFIIKIGVVVERKNYLIDNGQLLIKLENVPYET